MVGKTEFTSGDVHTQFLELESEYNLFDIQINGVPVWERVRFQINRQLLQKLDLIGSTGEERSATSRYSVENLRQIGQALTTRNPLFFSSADVLAWGLSRRKLLNDGYYWDLYCDPIYEQLDIDYLHAEDAYRGTHKRPAKTRRIAYLDFVSLVEQIAPETTVSPSSLDEPVRRKIASFESSLADSFGVSLGVQSIVRKTMRQRAVRRPLYDVLLDRIRPSVVLIVKSYGKETFVETCKKKDIPIVELQHGALSQYHLGYSFPSERTKEAFPDYFFAFGNHFATLAEFPIPQEKVRSVGYPYLEMTLQEKNMVTDTGYLGEGPVLFLSQGTIGERLSKVAVELNDDDKFEREIIYKLHPQEYHDWETTYPRLKDCSVTVVDSDAPSLYDLFGGCSVQVGVYSTALYEGLAFGLRTFLLNTDRIEFVRDIVEKGWATVIDSAADITPELSSEKSAGVPREELFEPEPWANIEQNLRHIRSE